MNGLCDCVSLLYDMEMRMMKVSDLKRISGMGSAGRHGRKCLRVICLMYFSGNEQVDDY